MRCDYNILLTTRIGFEKIAEALLTEKIEGIKVKTMPVGYKGLILAWHDKPYTVLEKILENNPYIEKGYVAESCPPAELDEISSHAADLASEKIKPNETFAVRTIRRGKHGFTSIDVNVKAGEEILRRTGARVDLGSPDKIVLINIVDDRAYISVIPGESVLRKMGEGKKPLYSRYHRIIVVQEPYVGPPDASRKMGERIGRIIQSYETGLYVAAPIEPVEASALKSFLEGLLEGIESRYRVELKAYGRRAYKSKAIVQSMYEAALRYHDHPLIIVEPEGEPVSRVSEELERLTMGKKKPVFLLGSRTGVPTGLYRYADLIIDIAPGITLSTETALATMLGVLGYLWEGGSIES